MGRPLSQGPDAVAAPRSHRLLVRAFPRWFRDEFGAELLAYLALQRAELRYRTRILGAFRFWWDAARDALVRGATLRLGRVSASWSDRTLARGARRAEVRGGGLLAGRGGRGGVLAAAARDARHAVRGLARTPGYALVFIVTLGLGIGANTAMFSAVNGVLLRPLPHAHGERLVYLRHSARLPGMENVLFSVPEIDDYRKGAGSLAAVAEFSSMTFTMLGHDVPRRLRTGIVTGNYFEVMGLGTTLGRAIGPADDGEPAAPVMVLSDTYWRSAFGADPGVLGRTVQINGRTTMIVGVAEPAPPYPERTDVYVNMAASPHHLGASMNHDRIHRMTEVFARLAPGATPASARAEVAAITSRLHADYPEAYDAGSGYGVSVTPLKAQLTSRARPALLVLLATAFLVLLIACANLANLTLTRVLRREHELAIRASLGASRAALRRGLLIENLALAVGGAGLGLLLASVSLDLLVRFAARFSSRASEISLDASVFGFALLAALLATLLFTLLPGLPGRDRIGLALARGGTRATIGSRARRLQRVLVTAQIGASFVLLIGAGLLLRTMLHLTRVDPGFDTAQVLSMNVPVNVEARTPPEVRAYQLTLLEDLRTLPGVESAALTASVPFSTAFGFSNQLEIDVDGHEPASGAPTPRADFRVVSPGYFATMGIRLLAGREFTSTDLEDTQPVVIINQSMARAYFGDRDPIGRRIAWTDPTLKFLGMGREWRTVVGVAEDTRDGGLDADVTHAMYNAHRQVTPFYTGFNGGIVLRIRVDAATVVSAAQKAILARDPNQPIVNVATIAELGSESVAPRRLNTILLGGFAVLALVIAAVGIGGVLAFSVGSRTREFGLRSALGAARQQILSGVLQEGATLAAAGVLLGALLALVLARFIAGLLIGVPTLDPVTFVAVGLLLGGVAIGASWLPAWRAARVSPMEALRTE